MSKMLLLKEKELGKLKIENLEVMTIEFDQVTEAVVGATGDIRIVYDYEEYVGSFTFSHNLLKIDTLLNKMKKPLRGQEREFLIETIKTGCRTITHTKSPMETLFEDPLLQKIGRLVAGAAILLIIIQVLHILP